MLNDSDFSVPFCGFGVRHFFSRFHLIVKLIVMFGVLMDKIFLQRKVLFVG